MKKDKSMKELEHLLEMAPIIIDNRSKDEVFARLKKEGLFDGKVELFENEDKEDYRERSKNSKTVEKQKGNRLATFIVAAVGLITFTGVGGYLLSQDNNSDLASSGDQEQNLEKHTSSEQDKSQGDTESFDVSTAITESSFIWPEDLQNATPLTLGLVSQNLEVVPVTVLIEQEQIQADFPNGQPTYVELYNHYASIVDEEAMGFLEFHPMEGAFELKNEELTHILPASHSYNMGSSSEIVYRDVVNATFHSAFAQIRVVNEQGNPVEFGHTGELKPFQLEADENVAYYILEGLLAPNKYEPFQSAKEAVEALQQSPQNESYKSPVVSGVSYTVTEENSSLTVTFTAPFEPTAFEEQDVHSMVEAIVLTAASFGKTVQFENVTTPEWNEYHLAEFLPIPVAYNKIK